MNNRRLKRLRIVVYHKQNGFCPICEESLHGRGELHHALITKGDVRGMSDESREKIHDKYNSVIVHTRCHPKATRERCYQFLKALYGDKVDKWLSSLPFRTKYPFLGGIHE